MLPKVLIVSKTEFNLSDSNGRVLGLLLKGIPNENKIQFCIHGNTVSSELIEQSYSITDTKILKGFFSRKIKVNTLSVDEKKKVITESKNRTIKKSALTMLIRDILWNIKISSTEFIDIAINFKPDIIIWQYGDSGFMANLVSILVKYTNAKLIVYSTEDYYFKKWNYLDKGKNSYFYPLYLYGMKQYTRKAFKNASLCICNTPQLAKRFKSEFNCRTEIIMQSSSEKCNHSFISIETKNRIVYAGNLGLNRHKSLISIAKALYKVDKSIVFEIYSCPSEIVKKELESAPNIRLKGFVNYENVLEIMHSSLLVVHAESFEHFYKYDLQAAFSTKIADSLAIGTPLFVFAPCELAETNYLLENNCAFVCYDKKHLYDSLYVALNDKNMRINIVDKAKAIAEINHNAVTNMKKMTDYLVENT